MTQMFAFGLGIACLNSKGEYLDTYFPMPLHKPSNELTQLLHAEVDEGVNVLSPARFDKIARLISDHSEKGCYPQTDPRQDNPDDAKDIQLVAVRLTTDHIIQSTPEAYLKLHLLSHCLCLPNTLNLEGLFQQLPTVCWTSQGPVDPREIDERLFSARMKNEHLDLHSVDKFPRMTNYVVPLGVRIADASRVRLGAYLGTGCTVMHAGFVNFNAGALGPNMIEGRISQGVIMGAHSDLGGSASTQGTLSGGGKLTNSIGENCLIGANAGTGIPLGDRCTIEAGLYVTAGTLVLLMDTGSKDSRVVKARELAGLNDLLFIRHSQTGKVLCRTNTAVIELNDALHSNN